MKRFVQSMLMIFLCMLMVCTTALAQIVNYTVKLEASTKIYQGSGVDYGYVKRVGQDGVYTIVEEAYDEYGNLWGRLKSGVGWVMLKEKAQSAGFELHDVPYTTELKKAEDICAGPGYEYGYLKDVGKDGIYTIVEEAIGEDGNLWGKLKSGVGWVMLAEGEAVSEKQAQIEAQEILYTVSLSLGEPIYHDVGGFSGSYGVIGGAAVFGITDELFCDGYLWGELASGAGWIRLTDVPSMGAPLLVADYYPVSLGAWVPIYSVPDYEIGMCSGIVGEDGVYTIVAEVEDELGNVWGKLKSGAGWVDLDYVRYMGNPTITAYFADVIDTIDPQWCDYTLEESEYMVRIAFRANEYLEDIRFMTLRYDADYEVEATHTWIQWMEKGEYFVAGVVFYGDMTTYGISFTDEEGEERHYAVSVSGMDGSLIMNEYVQ